MTPALSLLLACAFSARAAGTLDAADADWRAQGFSVKERVKGVNDELKADAALYSPDAGGGDRLEVRVIVKGKAYLGFTHPSTVERLEFDDSPAGRFADVFHDGSTALAYRSTRVALGASELNILRWRRFKIDRVAVFPEGRFLRLDGEALVASRRLPLGRYLSVGCEDFGTISRTAFKTSLNSARSGAFREVSGAHPGFYESEIVRKERAMAGLKDSLEKNAGEYLGLAVSSYYDYETLGRAGEGWTRLREFFKIPALAPGKVKKCMAAMEKDLRERLGVPADVP